MWVSRIPEDQGGLTLQVVAKQKKRAEDVQNMDAGKVPKASLEACWTTIADSLVNKSPKDVGARLVVNKTPRIAPCSHLSPWEMCI